MSAENYRQFGIVLTGQINPGVDIDLFRQRIIAEVEAVCLPDKDMLLLGLQFRELPRPKKEDGNDAAPDRGVSEGGRSGHAG